MRRAQIGQGFLNRRTDLNFARASAARDLKAHHRLAIEQGRRAWLGHGVADAGDLFQAQASTIGQRQRDARQGLGVGHAAQGAHRLFASGHIGAPARAVGLHLLELARNICGTRAQGLQALGVQGDVNLALHATHPVDRAHAAHGQQLARNLVVDKPRQGLWVHVGRAHRVGQDGLAGQVEFGDDGVFQVTGQLAADAVDG